MISILRLACNKAHSLVVLLNHKMVVMAFHGIQPLWAHIYLLIHLSVHLSVTIGRTDYVTGKRKVTVDTEKNDGKNMK
jgi:hypothetical protein